MIDHDKVIAWKTEQLNSGAASTMSEEMAQYVEQHQDLQQQLAFMEQFWQAENAPSVPSERMRARFQTLLTQTPTSEPAPMSKLNHWWQQLRGQMWMPAIYQTCALGLVFLLGMWVNERSEDQRQVGQLSQLQQDVASLSTLMAISLLQKPSASERLSGIAYSRRSNLTDPALLQTLVTLLEQDKSTAVRLAVVETLGAEPLSEDLLETLMQMASRETSPLVQMEICRLLLAQGGTNIRQHLKQTMAQPSVHPDVAEFIQTLENELRI